jgi:molecular chaperone GrpE
VSTRENGSEEEPVIRDNRKIDPETGQARQPKPADETAEQAGEQADQPSVAANLASIELATQLAERTADLQRLQAEYSNYRKRVERDRAAVREQAVAGALVELLPVLDDIGRARDHGELTGGFAKVSESLEAATGKLGLTTFGTKGEPFDPTVHEALIHSYSPDVTEPTCVEILQPGYRIGERVLRPARVAVAEPEEPAAGDN